MAVDVRRSPRLIRSSDDEQNVRVWQATFLKLHHIGVSYCVTEHPVSRELTKQLSKLLAKTPRDQIWAIPKLLPGTQIRLHFILFWVCRHCDKEIGATKFGNQAHGIQV